MPARLMQLAEKNQETLAQKVPFFFFNLKMDFPQLFIENSNLSITD